MKDHVIKFFQFLESKEGKNAPLKFKILNPGEFKVTKDELDVKRNLDLSGTNIKSLPNGLRVRWSLDLQRCTSLISLPEGLQVGWSLKLYGCTSLKSLPDDLHVSETLFLNNCTSLTSLPNRLQVGTNLFLKNTPLAKMYSVDEIRAMIKSSGGYVNGRIIV